MKRPIEFKFLADWVFQSTYGELYCGDVLFLVEATVSRIPGYVTDYQFETVDKVKLARATEFESQTGTRLVLPAGMEVTSSVLNTREFYSSIVHAAIEYAMKG